jgi:Fe-S-cluster containining protein
MSTPHPDSFLDAPDSGVAADCRHCDAVCCRLTVVVQPEDRIPGHLLEERDGLTVMARDEEGWCVALDGARMCCSIYEGRPEVCRRFAMDGPYCRAIRADYSERRARGIELILH